MNLKPTYALLATCFAFGVTTAHAQSGIPDPIKVPDGHVIVMKTVGVGEITYECRDKAKAPGQTEWFFVGPKAVLKDRAGNTVGDYFGPPATWQAKDGSKVTGTQLAVAPAAKADLPYQLVKANPAEGQGAMQGVSYIQRLATRGGVAPAEACNAQNKGKQQVVKYQADYVFWAAK
ncbi:DUF3455 domain-containing protein [Pseudomonas sp. S60]|uniref:DUF3455 domain-containing protein n=1 Tax=unclassified Pseudomonas TaxID=196821 RepID=UPI0019123365|nr:MULTISPECIES: DUF3455 domain-containing protein [unclassified Pseudomonas]MBK5008086.1 DUF3455 domain-containing protein [Pseudomonas sp. S32]MBK5012931.1 DUF3455 domain-containing protein [Pseudomonas sp. S60]